MQQDEEVLTTKNKTMQNITVEGNYTSETTPTWLTGVMACISALNIFLTITALLGNALILIALHKAFVSMSGSHPLLQLYITGPSCSKDG